MDFEAARAQQGVVEEVFPVGEADDEDVGDGLDAVDLGEELVDDGIADVAAGGGGGDAADDAGSESRAGVSCRYSGR